MKQQLTFLTLRDVSTNIVYQLESFNDIKQFVKDTKFKGNQNFIGVDLRKWVFDLNTDDVIVNPNIIQSVEGKGYLKPKNGEVHYCLDKTGVKNIEDMPVSKLKFMYVYNMSNKYYKVFRQFYGQLNFFVMNKLEYQSAIEKRFRNKWVRCPTRDWKADVWPEEYPEMPCLCEDSPRDKNWLYAIELTKQDIVVDRNLNQIWPIATKQPPVGVIELLNKKTEKVY